MKIDISHTCGANNYHQLLKSNPSDEYLSFELNATVVDRLY